MKVWEAIAEFVPDHLYNVLSFEEDYFVGDVETRHGKDVICTYNESERKKEMRVGTVLDIQGKGINYESDKANWVGAEFCLNKYDSESPIVCRSQLSSVIDAAKDCRHMKLFKDSTGNKYQIIALTSPVIIDCEENYKRLHSYVFGHFQFTELLMRSQSLMLDLGNIKQSTGAYKCLSEPTKRFVVQEGWQYIRQFYSSKGV